jgi:hypothetical protein
VEQNFGTSRWPLCVCSYLLRGSALCLCIFLLTTCFIKHISRTGELGAKPVKLFHVIFEAFTSDFEVSRSGGGGGVAAVARRASFCICGGGREAAGFRSNPPAAATWSSCRHWWLPVGAGGVGVVHDGVGHATSLARLLAPVVFRGIAMDTRS